MHRRYSSFQRLGETKIVRLQSGRKDGAAESGGVEHHETSAFARRAVISARPEKVEVIGNVVSYAHLLRCARKSHIAAVARESPGIGTTGGMEGFDDLLFGLDIDENAASSTVGDDGPAGETAREKRIRQALAEAKRNYTAHIDTNAWFFESDLRRRIARLTDVVVEDCLVDQDLQKTVGLGLKEDNRFGQKLEWTLGQLYTTSEYSKTFILALNCLQVHSAANFSLEPTPVPLSVAQNGCCRLSLLRWKRPNQGVVRGKDRAALTDSRMSTNETVDMAMRAAVQLPASNLQHPKVRAACEALVSYAADTATFQLQQSPSSMWQSCISTAEFEKIRHELVWSTQAGLLQSAGELCQQIDSPSEAIEAFAVVIASRGPLWKLYRTISILLLQIRPTNDSVHTLARAAAYSALLICHNPERRANLTKEIVSAFSQAGVAINETNLSESPSDDTDEHADLIRAILPLRSMSLIALVTLVHASLGRKGNRIRSRSSLLAQAISDVCKHDNLGNEKSTEEDAANEGRAFTSVRAL